MRRALTTVADFVLWVVLQLPLMGAWAVLALVGKYTKRWYYAVVVARRRLRGEPIWQPHDLLIGMPPPADRAAALAYAEAIRRASENR